MACGFGFNVEQDYFHWLCEIIHADQETTSYWLLMKDLHSMEFYSLIDRDENRAYDGQSLRDDYLRQIGYPKYVDIRGECSVLEMLIALAQRMEFETCNPYDSDIENEYSGTVYWFWEMIDNLGLMPYSDDEYMDLDGIDGVRDIVSRWLEREYLPSGEGGLFPLAFPRQDQRDVEIWYQMCAFLSEKKAV